MTPPEQAAPREASDAASGATGLLEALNPPQREAVVHPGGPILVLAGAGSGKTRVIAHRIAWLILEAAVAPDRIVAVTFTNKAAGEMRARVENLLGARALDAWIGTFHALCLRILRREGRRIGLDPSFAIYDGDDQLALVRAILSEESADDTAVAVRSLLSAISRLKNSITDPAAVEAKAFSPEARLLARVYARYEESLRRQNVVDFDDLLLRTLELFGREPHVGDAYAERCEHLLVDEYQDTNRPQYLLVRALAARHGNVCVVGDEDQSIYAFRGAEIRNILDFEKDHPGAKVVKLEQNYRSTGVILEAASGLISRNLARKGKALWTANAAGDPLEVCFAPDDRTEARWIVRKIAEMEGRYRPEHFAVLYRTNAQSRPLEELLRSARIPYHVVGAVQFYERKEVKDVLAYLKLLANPADDVAFRRIVNTPSRGVGDSTLAVVEELGRSRGLPLRDAATRALEEGLLPGRSARELRAFLNLLGEFAGMAAAVVPNLLLEHLIRDLRYGAYLQKTYGAEAADRMENVGALVSAAADYAEEDPSPSLQGFLDRSALVSDADEVGMGPGVALMTVHCAKGLEFPVVFLAGLEESLFPHVRSIERVDQIEEERRLCYVAMTRARERLFLSLAARRRVQGTFLPTRPSRFLEELPPTLLRPSRLEFDDGIAEPRSHFRAIAPRAASSSALRAAARAAHDPPFARIPRRGEDPGDGFPVGAAVVHPKFGHGVILERQGSGATLKLTIRFAAQGDKKILPAYTQLEVGKEPAPERSEVDR